MKLLGDWSLSILLGQVSTVVELPSQGWRGSSRDWMRGHGASIVVLGAFIGDAKFIPSAVPCWSRLPRCESSRSFRKSTTPTLASARLKH